MTKTLTALRLVSDHGDVEDSASICRILSLGTDSMNAQIDLEEAIAAAVATPHPADELKTVRDKIKAFEKREKALKALISGDRELRVGTAVHAIVSERSRSTPDWKGLALKLGATPAQVEEHTKTTTYEVVEVERLPDLAEVVRMLLEDELVVVDCETTGFSPAAEDRIVSVAAQPAFLSENAGVELQLGNRAMIEEVNPGRPSSPQALAVHGLEDAFLSEQPPFLEIARLLREVIGNAVIVAHNAPFDMGFLNMEFERAGMKPIANPVIDTRILSKLLWPNEKATLDAMAERLGVDRGARDERHDALEDCRLLARCLPGLVAMLKGRI